ncbi:unnamed protein product [Ectocarpus sp. 4 AP-2014]
MAPEATHLPVASQRLTSLKGETAPTTINVIAPTTVAMTTAAASASSRRSTRGDDGGNRAGENVSGDAGQCGRRQQRLLHEKRSQQQQQPQKEGGGRGAATPTTAAAEPPLPPPSMQHVDAAGENGGGGGGSESRVGSVAEDCFSSSASFGSVTQTKPVGTGTSTWKGSFVKGSRRCCSCVPLSRGGSSADARVSSGQAGAPETFDGEGDGWGKPQEPTEKVKGKGGFRPRHRRGHSTGNIAHGTNPSARAARITQPQGWEAGGGGSSATTSTTSSTGSTALAVAAASGGGEGGRETVLSWGRRSGSWGAGGVAAADREFNRILKSGIDVYKHSSTPESTQQWVDVVPKRIKEFLSRSCPLEDENEGLVTLFLDQERENLCWCPPGAAELVPDERYSLSVRSLVEVVPGDSVHPRVLSLRSAGRANPLVFDLDSDDLYDILSEGIVRILERNHLRDTLMVDPRNVAAI